MVIEDTDDDGISFWFPPDANNDGSGSIRFIDFAGKFYNIEPDFGKFTEFNFVAGVTTSTEDVQNLDPSFIMYPNPSNGEVYFTGFDDWKDAITITVADQLGRELFRTTQDKHVLYNGIDQIDRLEAGTYIIVLSDGHKREGKKLIKM